MIAVDDCWMKPSRDDQGHLIVDDVKFPEGMASLAANLVSDGWRFGLYASAGTATCKSGAGSLDHEQIDAIDFK